MRIILILLSVLMMNFFRKVSNTNDDTTNQDKFEHLAGSGDSWDRKITVSALHVIYFKKIVLVTSIFDQICCYLLGKSRPRFS